MSRRSRLSLAVLGASLLAGAPAHAALKPCGPALQCGRVAVPLDPTGRVPGTVQLSVKRYSRSSNPIGTVLALAGGPGQAAVPLLRAFENDLRPLLADHAVVVFDPRGVGRSGRLRCQVAGRTPVKRIGSCARDLGPRRAF